MASLDFDRAAAFIAAIPRGRWASYKDVATAAGAPGGAQAVGDWLRRRGHEVPHVHRVLRSDGFVPDAFQPAGPGVAANAQTARALLREEGVALDAQGRAKQTARFTAGDGEA